MTNLSKILMLASFIFPATQAFALQTSFTSRVSKSEDCRAGFNNCRRQSLYVGDACRISVDVTGDSGRLSSKQELNGSSRMGIAGAPKINSGSVTVNGQTYKIRSGLRSDNFTLGGSFSAFMGATSGSGLGARVFFKRVKGVPRAYAATVYFDGQAVQCGKIVSR